MAFQLPDLPYSKDALAPHISAETLEFHWGKHHRAYFTKTSDAVQSRQDLSSASLVEIIRINLPSGFCCSAGARHCQKKLWFQIWALLLNSLLSPSCRALRITSTNDAPLRSGRDCTASLVLVK